MEQPILITGCARSGTSMTAGLIHSVGGVFGGGLSGPNKYNSKGMFENLSIRNQLVKPFLKSINCDPLGQFPLPDTKDIEKFTSTFCNKWRGQVQEIMSKEGYKGGVWFYKGAKMCLIWQIWHKAFPGAKWVIVRRETEDIVNSCLRTSFMRAHKKRSGWISWVAEHEKRFEDMVDEKLNIQEVWPQRMVQGDFSEMQIVINNLGLEWDLEKANDFVDPGLWRKWLSKRKRHGK